LANCHEFLINDFVIYIGLNLDNVLMKRSLNVRMGQNSISL